MGTAPASPALPLLSRLDTGGWRETADGSSAGVFGELKAPAVYVSTALASGLN